MSTNAHKDFSTFLSQLSDTNATLGFFSNFEKISRNVAKISINLHTLNYLIGKQDLTKAVHELWDKDPSIFTVLGILIAVRNTKDTKVINNNCNFVTLNSYYQSPEKVIEFMEGTGLADVFRTTKIKDLHDYVFGVETGLDTNARKNRSGDITEEHIHQILTSAGIPHQAEVYGSCYPAVAQVLGADEKRFDFTIETKRCVYLMEVNFYSKGGSKLNETARAYTDLAPKVNSVPGFEFVWITDGQGWKAAKNKLEEAYNAIPSVYNFTTLPNFIKKIQAELGIQ